MPRWRRNRTWAAKRWMKQEVEDGVGGMIGSEGGTVWQPLKNCK